MTSISYKRHLLTHGRVSLFFYHTYTGFRVCRPRTIAFAMAAVAALTLSHSAHTYAAPVTTSPEEQYLAYADSADMAIAAERWDRAEEMIKAAMRLSPSNPGNPMLFANLGVCLANRHKYGEALEAFEIGLVKAPRSTAILSSRALTYIAMGREDDALADLDTVLQCDSTLLQPRRVRAQILLARNDTTAAAGDFRTLRSLDPSQADSYTGLARCAEMKGEYQEACSLYNEALQREKDTDIQPLLHIGLIRSLIVQEKLNEADEAVRQALAAFPRNGYIYLMRAWLHRLRFQYEDEIIDKKMAAEYGVEIQTIESFLPSHN